MYKTINLHEPEHLLYQEFIEQNKITYPRLSYNEERDEIKLSFAAEEHDPIKLWGKAIKHFKTTLVKTRIQTKDGRISIFFKHV